MVGEEIPEDEEDEEGAIEAIKAVLEAVKQGVSRDAWSCMIV